MTKKAPFKTILGLTILITGTAMLMTGCGKGKPSQAEQIKNANESIEKLNEANAALKEESASESTVSASSEEPAPAEIKTEIKKAPAGIATDFQADNLKLVDFKDYRAMVPNTWIEEDSTKDTIRVFYPDTNEESVFELGVLPNKGYISDLREELFKSLLVSLAQEHEEFSLMSATDVYINRIPMLKMVSKEKFNGKNAVAVRTYTLNTDKTSKIMYTSYIQPVNAAQDHFLDCGMVVESIRTGNNKFDDVLMLKEEEDVKVREDSIPEEDKEAVTASATGLLNTDYYTRKQLIEALTEMGYSEDAALYGADHCGVEWTQDQSANY